MRLMQVSLVGVLKDGDDVWRVSRGSPPIPGVARFVIQVNAVACRHSRKGVRDPYAITVVNKQ